MFRHGLAFGLAAARGLGIFDRTEPACALVDLHLDLRVPAAGGPVIDALACTVDVALDGAIGRWRDRAGGRSQQDRMGIRRRLGGAEDCGLLVADAPVPRRDEGALPHAGLGLARGGLVGIVVMGEAHIGQGPAAPHQPFLDVLAVDLAMSHDAAAAIGALDMAGPALVLDVLGKFVARRGTAGPAFALGVEAELVGRRRVDAAEANTARADLDLIAVADLRRAGQVGRLRDRRQQQDRGGNEKGRDFHRWSRRGNGHIIYNGANPAGKFSLVGRVSDSVTRRWQAADYASANPPYWT